MLVAVQTKYPINGDVYNRARAAMDAIDDMAEALIGDRQFFLSGRFPS